MKLAHFPYSRPQLEPMLGAHLAGNGQITFDEFVAIMKRPQDGIVPEWEDAHLIELFQEMDADGGGTVSYHEFAARWTP